MGTKPSNRVRYVALALVAWSSQALFAAPVDLRLPSEVVELRPSLHPGYAIAATKCGICHSFDYIAYQPPAMTTAQWTAEVAKMQHAYGAPIDGGEIVAIGDYLGSTYGNGNRDPGAAVVAASANASPASASPVDAQTLLTRNGCLACHAIDHQVVGPAYKDVAARYRSDPAAQAKLETSIRNGSSGKWGAAAMPPFGGIDPGQLEILVEFVRAQ